VFVCIYIYTHTQYVCVCVCTYTHTHTYIYIYIYQVKFDVFLGQRFILECTGKVVVGDAVTDAVEYPDSPYCYGSRTSYLTGYTLSEQKRPQL
jgi:hypothetical protein